MVTKVKPIPDGASVVIPRLVCRDPGAEIDFIADDPGLTLYHCHMQLHMDFGFMALMKYA